jgi:hypothetical protein
MEEEREEEAKAGEKRSRGDCLMEEAAMRRTRRGRWRWISDEGGEEGKEEKENVGVDVEEEEEEEEVRECVGTMREGGRRGNRNKKMKAYDIARRSILYNTF